MATDVIKIKCPNCGAVLTVKNVPGLAAKNLTCPVCKHKDKVIAFRSLASNQDGNDDVDDSCTHYSSSSVSGSAVADINQLPGQLRVISTGQVFPLKMGRNVVGRKASSSSADIQLPAGDSKRMSRSHVVINVMKETGTSITTHISLFKENVNKTFVKGNEVLYGDELVLNDGDVIELPDLKVVYEIPDDEKTKNNP